MTPPPIPAPPNSVVWSATPTTSPAIESDRTAAIRLGWECWWVDGPITFSDLAVTPTVIVLAPGGTLAAPKRVRSEIIPPLGPPKPTPLEAAIADELAAIEVLGLELQRRYARVIELQARLEAGETEVNNAP